jgi:hypothetical protein
MLTETARCASARSTPAMARASSGSVGGSVAMSLPGGPPAARA